MTRVYELARRLYPETLGNATNGAHLPVVFTFNVPPGRGCDHIIPLVHVISHNHNGVLQCMSTVDNLLTIGLTNRLYLRNMKTD